MFSKKILVAISISALLGISFFGLNNLLSANENVVDTITVNDLPTTSLDEKNENGNNDYSNDKDNNKTYQKISTTADFVKIYNDFDSLLEDSSLVVSGKVKDLESYITEYDSIYTNFELNIKDVIKGNVDDKQISIYTQGGSVPYGEYFTSQEELFKTKLSEEAFNQAKEDSINKADQLVTSNFATLTH